MDNQLVYAPLYKDILELDHDAHVVGQVAHALAGLLQGVSAVGCV
jgi:hypothetical protein